MPGTGYNIPVSVSASATTTINPIANAATTFNFSSPWASGGSNDISSRPTSDATATSSAAEGNAAANSQSTATGATGGGSVGSSLTTYLPYVIGGIGVISLGIILWLHFRN